MTLNSFKRAIIGLALAAGIPLAAGTAPTTHAGGNPSIYASWKAGVLTVSGSGFSNGGAVDVVVYDDTNGVVYSSYGSKSAKPAAATVASAQLPFCKTPGPWCYMYGAMFGTSFSTLNPPACSTGPDALNFPTGYEVVAFDETTKTMSNIYTVSAACGTGLGYSAPPPTAPTIAAGLNSTTGVLSVLGSSFTTGGIVDVTFFLNGQPLGTAQTTAKSSCGWLCFPVYVTFPTGVTGCGPTVFTVLAMDEATHRLSNEVQVYNYCPTK